MKTVKATMRIEVTMDVPDDADESKILTSIKYGDIKFKPAYNHVLIGMELIETNVDSEYLIDEDESESVKGYVNHYLCEDCGHEWNDIADSMCDDECPNCSTVMTPYDSTELV